MCGKFTQMASWREVVDFSQPLALKPGEAQRIYTSMNVLPVLRLDDQGQRIVSPMNWAFTDRKATGHRTPRHFHARGETVDRVFANGFRFRRGIVLANTFNEGEEVDVSYSDGAPAGRTWTRQWTIRPDGCAPLLLGVLYDVFDCGRGPEFEFVQVTTAANTLISRITDRMPLVLRPDDAPLWLGEVRAPMIDVKALIRPYEDEGAWRMVIEDPRKKPPRPRNPHPRSTQGELF